MLGLSTPGCGPESETGVWVRITSPVVTITSVHLFIYDATSLDPDPVFEINVPEAPLSEPRTFDPTSTSPENQLWVLILAGQQVRESIRIVAVGFREEREVADGELENVLFVRNKIIEHCDEEGVLLPLELTGCIDKDEDGYCESNDCDDDDAAVNPGAEEVCDDKDNNCDGARDEGCPCSPGDQRDCWPQWARALETVCLHDEDPTCACEMGTQSCNDGQWGGCIGLITPVAEGKLDANGNPVECRDGGFLCYPTCDDGIDNDCNSFLDDRDTGCGGCVPGTERDCYTGPPDTRKKGVCHDGKQTCQDDGTWPEECPGQRTPEGWSEENPDGAAEFDLCDGRDNDCDTIIDNVTVFPACTKNQGCCRDAVKQCVDGDWVDCERVDYEMFAHDTCYTGLLGDDYDYYIEGEETTDYCDSLDNDCNGEPDDVYDPDSGERLCKCSVGDTAVCEDRTEGICVPGLFICVDGELVMDQHCVPGLDAELCDDLDNTCDGNTDLTEDARLDCLNNIVGEQQNASVVRCIHGVCDCDCDDGWWDNDDDLCTMGGGCEYGPCYQTTGGVERCDNTDNNCNGLFDAADQPLASVDALCPYRDDSSIPGRGLPGGPAEACVNGVCQYECNDPYDDCNGDLRLPVPLPGEEDSSDGCESDLRDDPEHCGQCGFACNQHAYCSMRSCHCNDDYDNCNSDWSDGCEIDLLNDHDNCGTCGFNCGANAHCSNGTCVCNSGGWTDCNNSWADGCEINVLTDATNCGTCDNDCGQHTICNNGSCACVNSDWGNCSGGWADGCETDLRVTDAHCGSCGFDCDQHAYCSGSTCHCDDGWGNCLNGWNDGCEQTLTTLQHCGSCNTPCSRAHATASCSSGSCQIASCDTNWDDCNSTDSDGCETSLETTSDCGSCGTSCSRAHASAECPNGNCQIDSCYSDWDDCNSVDSDGCETPLTTLTDCGACEVTCSLAHASESCSTGTCRITSCQSDWDDCNSTDSDGCETDLRNTDNHCGSCNNSCGQNAYCSSSTCNCDADWGNCINGWSDGCETPLGTMSNCSTCGDDCDDDNPCTTDSCVSVGDGCSNTNNTIACNDGIYCNGTDTCSGGSCSQHSGDPCPGADGDGDCSETCNDVADDCSAADPNGSSCDDGAYCNGTDTCSGGSCSQHTGDPCPGPDGDGDCSESCNDVADNCSAADPNDSACDDGTYCNGTDTCSGGSCSQHSGDPCPGADGDADCSESCNETADNCSANDPNGSACDDGTYCNGTDTCSGGSCSQHSGDPCPGADGDLDCSETCDDVADNCNADDPNGSSCATNATCSSGACTCSADYDDCDSDMVNGCETELGTTTDCAGCEDTCGPTTNKVCIIDSPNFCGCTNNGDCDTGNGETCNTTTHLCEN